MIVYINEIETIEKVNIFSNISEKYATRIKENLMDLYIINDNQSIYCDCVFKDDEIVTIKRIDLNFAFYSEEEILEVANELLNQTDYSMIMIISEIFNKVAIKEILEHEKYE